MIEFDLVNDQDMTWWNGGIVDSFDYGGIRKGYTKMEGGDGRGDGWGFFFSSASNYIRGVGLLD